MGGIDLMICTLIIIVGSFGSVLSTISLFGTNISLFTDYSKQYPQMRAKCRSQIDTLTNSDPKALAKMIDASTKLPSDILNGSVHDLGSYDECYDIKSNLGYNDGPIYGKYCLEGIKSTAQGVVAGFVVNYSGFKAICIPSGCTGKDFSTNFTSIIGRYCYSRAEPNELDAGALISISVLMVLALLVVLSTLYDISLYYLKIFSPNELFTVFSVLTNGRKIFTSTTNQNQLLCLNGIKAISMMWVVLGHSYSLDVNQSRGTYLSTITKFKTNLTYMFAFNAALSVDTFLFVSGLLTVYTYLRSVKDEKMEFNIVKYYLHRILRLTPALAISIMICAFLVRFLGDGPLWNFADESLGVPCRKKWWSTLLYIQNYVPGVTCLPPSWYLSVDMQLHFLSPIILILMVKVPSLYTLVTLSCLVISGMVIPFVVTYFHRISPFIAQLNQNPETFSSYYYSQTYARFAPYVCGMLSGYFIYEIKKGTRFLNLTKMQIVVLWMVALMILFASIYAPYVLLQMDYDRWIYSTFCGYSHVIWSIGLGLIVVLCVSDYGGPINSFLSLSIFQILAKLSYSMYLIHAIIIFLRVSQSRTLVPFQVLEMTWKFWGDIVYSVAAGLLLCLMAESPVIMLENRFLR